MTTKYMIKSLITNIFLTSTKMIFGYISKSKTLIADAVHSLSDTITDVIGIIGSKIAQKKPDRNHPYGHGKAEYVTSLFISLLIIYLSFEIFNNSFNIASENSSYLILIISLFSIIVKYFLSSFLIKKGKKINSPILVSSGIESRYDCLSGLIAFIFITLSLFSKDIKILKYADNVGSVIISILTFKIGLSFFIENFKSSIGEVDLDKEKIDEIKNIVKSYKEVKKVLNVTIFKYGYYKNVIIDITLPSTLMVKDLYKIQNNIKKSVHSLSNDYRFINLNFKPNKKRNKPKK